MGHFYSQLCHVGGLVFLLGFAVVSAVEDPLIEALGDQDFERREAAAQDLVEATLETRDEVIDCLLVAEENIDPEIARRASGVLEQIFLRLEKGIGAPQTGLILKSKIVTLNKKLATRALVAGVEEGTAAAGSTLKKGDIILSVDGVLCDGEDGAAKLMEVLHKQTSDTQLLIRYARHSKNGSEEAETNLVLGTGKPIPKNFDGHRLDFDFWKSKEIARGKE